MRLTTGPTIRTGALEGPRAPVASRRRRRRALELERNPSGPRVYVIGRRLHHGAAGVALLTLATSSPVRRRRAPSARAVLIGAVGAVLIAHDRRDFPFRDIDNH